MIFTNDLEISNRCKSLRNLCFQSENRFVHKELGWNYRMTNLQAALGLAQLEKLDLTMQGLVNEILSSNIIDNEEKCVRLYETTNYIGDNSFDEFVKDVSFKCSREEALRISKKNSETIDF